MTVLWFLAALSLAYTAAAMLWLPLFGRTATGSKPSRVAVVLATAIAVGAVAASPLVVIGEGLAALLLRGAVALVSTDLVLRLIEAARHARHDRMPLAWSAYWRFLIPFPIFQVVLESRQRAPWHGPRWIEVARAATCAAIFAAVIATIVQVHDWPLLQHWFAIDHCFKVLLFTIGLEAVAQGLLGVERLVGFNLRPIIERIFWAHSPADFWKRYNRRVQRWLYLNVFLPSGGRQSPVRGVVATFAFSGALHELMVDVAIRRVSGYQLAFFLLQIPAVLVSPAIERMVARGGFWRLAFGHVVTVLWMTASSMLFLYGVEQVFPYFYAAEPWLP